MCNHQSAFQWHAILLKWLDDKETKIRGTHIGGTAPPRTQFLLVCAEIARDCNPAAGAGWRSCSVCALGDGPRLGRCWWPPWRAATGSASRQTAITRAPRQRSPGSGPVSRDKYPHQGRGLFHHQSRHSNTLGPVWFHHRGQVKWGFERVHFLTRFWKLWQHWKMCLCSLQGLVRRHCCIARTWSETWMPVPSMWF